jgi:hypothetical protein
VKPKTGLMKFDSSLGSVSRGSDSIVGVKLVKLSMRHYERKIGLRSLLAWLANL